MDWKRIAPWNWFKDEQAERSSAVPSERTPDAFDALRRELLSLFDESARGLFPQAFSASEGREGPRLPIRPSVDISEGRKTYKVRAELPGVDRDDVSLHVDGQTLEIRAEKREDREDEEEGYHWVERSYGSVRRVLSLPDDADSESIDARFKNGVLTLLIPKHAASVAPGRSIEVQAG
jgi:HSP20 family protein